MANSNHSQLALRGILITLLIALVIYTFFTIQKDGFNFFAKAFGYLQSMEWSGQFSLDFLCYLILSALWVAWREGLTGQAYLLALLASVGGFLFLSVYLLILIGKSNGNIKQVLLGKQA